MERIENETITLEHLRYNLPESSVARYPASERGSSRLLVYNQQIIDSKFYSLTSFLPPSSMLVFNNTKVINARIEFKKLSGSRIEVFCLEPVSPKEITEAFSAIGTVTWNCLVGNLKRWKQDEVLVKSLVVNGISVDVKAYLVEKLGKNNLVRFEWKDKRFSFSEILDSMGTLPIPPYLDRDTELVDTVRYQTVYSHHKGSVAAQTAGLHFTQKMLDELIHNGHQLEYLTLHVGAGTFKPIKDEDITKHEMHQELFVVRKNFIEELLHSKGALVAVGTTSVRTIESIYWLGVKLLSGDSVLSVSQWQPYENEVTTSKDEALKAVLYFMNAHKLEVVEASTSIMIKPGYKFRLVEIIITNFHQPESTLLLLVSAFIGYKNCMTIYDHAIQCGYKFLSYGDSSLLFPTH